MIVRYAFGGMPTHDGRPFINKNIDFYGSYPYFFYVRVVGVKWTDTQRRRPRGLFTECVPRLSSSSIKCFPISIFQNDNITKDGRTCLQIITNSRYFLPLIEGHSLFHECLPAESHTECWKIPTFVRNV